MFFDNILLPSAKALEVKEAICRWHLAAGYRQEVGRQLFHRSYRDDEERVFILSNERWCVVIHSFQDGFKVRKMFGEFPVLVRFWAKDGNWGYDLEENGQRTATFYWKRSLAKGMFPGKNRDAERLANACGLKDAGRSLSRLTKRFLFINKSCGQFAEALGAPVAMLRFSDLESANDGVTEERRVGEWNCQMFCFKKEFPAERVPPWGRLSDSERTAAVERVAQFRKRFNWVRLLAMPLTILAALAAQLALVFLIVFGLPIMFLNRQARVRKFFFGKASEDGNSFVEELRSKEWVQVNGDLAINMKHGCSIIVPPGIVVLRKPLPRKCSMFEEPVFQIECENNYFSCNAYMSGRLPTQSGAEVLERKSFAISNWEVEFKKKRTTWARRTSWHCEWSVKTPQAVYQFSRNSETELTNEKLEVLENIVRSFKLGA